MIDLFVVNDLQNCYIPAACEQSKTRMFSVCRSLVAVWILLWLSTSLEQCKGGKGTNRGAVAVG